MKRETKIFAVFFILLMNVFTPSASALIPINVVKDEAAKTSENAEVTEDPIVKAERRLKEIKSDRSKLEMELSKLPADAVEILQKQKLDLLKKSEIVLDQFIDLSRKESKLSAKVESIAAEIIKTQQLVAGEQKTTSIVQFDQMNKEKSILKDKRKQTKKNITELKKAAELLGLDIEEKQKALRFLNDGSEKANEAASPDLLTLEIEQLQMSKSVIDLRIKAADEDLTILDMEMKLADARITSVQDKIEFSKLMLEDTLAKQDVEEKELKSELNQLKLDLHQVEKKLLFFQSRNEESAEMLLVETSRDFLNKKIELITSYLSLFPDMEQTWQSRYEYFNKDKTPEFLKGWSKETKKFLKSTNELYQRVLKSLLDNHKTLGLLREKLADKQGTTEEFRKQLKDEIKFLKEYMTFANDLILKVENTSDFYKMINEDHLKALNEFNWDVFWDDATDVIVTVWNYEVFVLDDKPLTVKKIIIALVLLFFGFFLSKVLSKSLRKRVYNRFIQTQSAREALQTVSYYLLLFIFTMFSLKTANVPLTMFTLLGGAFAIGIGFGSQNLINNFISGLILLAERPIKVGDMIEVDGNYGEVKRIGARSTNVRTAANIDIMVPNSHFLEKNVVNWTLNDDRYRTNMSLGVSYGSDVRLVERLLNQALKENPDVLREPEYKVLFSNFGDNSLVFEMYFSIRMRFQMERRRIESDIRYRIDELFRDHGISIAFPQRDLHIDTIRPLEVKMVSK